MTNIQKTEAFLKEKFDGCDYYKEHSADQEYRLQHSYRVAHAAREIARAEGLDEEGLIIGALLHDVGYCLCSGDNWPDWPEHGRISARIARPFLEQLGLERKRVQEICYGIAIHVDGDADFPGEKTPFACSIHDADEVDHFDVYRIYEAMMYEDFRNLRMTDKKKWLLGKLDRIQHQMGKQYSTETGRRMITERLLYQRQYYERLLEQMERSERIEITHSAILFES